jgi:hypothetical protein
MTSLLRSLFWFEPGELSEIYRKVFRIRKPGYEAQWESIVLLTLLVGLCGSFVAYIYLGLACLWGFKFSIQALNKKKFFDPLP